MGKGLENLGKAWKHKGKGLEKLGKHWKYTGRGLEKLGEEADRQPQCAGTVRGEEGWWFVTKTDIK